MQLSWRQIDVDGLDHCLKRYDKQVKNWNSASALDSQEFIYLSSAKNDAAQNLIQEPFTQRKAIVFKRQTAEQQYQS